MSEPLCANGIILWWGHKYVKLYNVQEDVEEIELMTPFFSGCRDELLQDVLKAQ